MSNQFVLHYETFPAFLAYFGMSVVFLVAFLWLYARITPHPEFALIREGNVAAAVALVGAAIGFVLPLASVIANSVNVMDAIAWGLVALVVQLGTFYAVRLAEPGLCDNIAAGRSASAVLVAGLSVAVGILNAACMNG